MCTSEEQRRRFWLTVISFLQILSWVSASRRSSVTPSGAHQLGQAPEFLPVPTHLDDKQDIKSFRRLLVNEEAYKGLSTLGSRPPSCEHKCGECFPCEAIQVPTNRGNFGVQYSNYEPEGWKCKCGTAFFNP